jgi:hypothetical protein
MVREEAAVVREEEAGVRWVPSIDDKKNRGAG